MEKTWKAEDMIRTQDILCFEAEKRRGEKRIIIRKKRKWGKENIRSIENEEVYWKKRRLTGIEFVGRESRWIFSFFVVYVKKKCVKPVDTVGTYAITNLCVWIKRNITKTTECTFFNFRSENDQEKSEWGERRKKWSSSSYSVVVLNVVLEKMMTLYHTHTHMYNRMEAIHS